MTMSTVQIWDEAGFRTAVRSGGLVLADFYSEWCGPCKIQAETLSGMSADIPENVQIGKVDVEAAPGVAAEFGIVSIPTLILFKDGAAVETHVGLCSRDKLLAMLKKYF